MLWVLSQVRACSRAACKPAAFRARAADRSPIGRFQNNPFCARPRADVDAPATAQISGDARAWHWRLGYAVRPCVRRGWTCRPVGKRPQPAAGQGWRVPSGPWRTQLHWSPGPIRASARRSRASSLPQASPSGSAPATLPAVKEIGGDARLLVLDVTDAASIADAARQAGSLDILVNNAGIS